VWFVNVLVVRLVVHNKNYTRLLVMKYFLRVVQFGCTRPIQDYDSGPGTQDGGQV
jgi:hypothetical protein